MDVQANKQAQARLLWVYFVENFISNNFYTNTFFSKTHSSSENRKNLFGGNKVHKRDMWGWQAQDSSEH